MILTIIFTLLHNNYKYYYTTTTKKISKGGEGHNSKRTTVILFKNGEIIKILKFKQSFLLLVIVNNYTHFLVHVTWIEGFYCPDRNNNEKKDFILNFFTK